MGVRAAAASVEPSTDRVQPRLTAASADGPRITHGDVLASTGRSYRLPVASTPFPGEQLVRAGLRDLADGVTSVESLLVSIGAPRLRRLGYEIPDPTPTPELRLYELLAAEDSDSAHSRYNALVRRLVSFERAAECAS